jgi:hypothetical protein
MSRARDKRGRQKPKRAAISGRLQSSQKTRQHQNGSRKADHQQSSSANGLLLAGGFALAGYVLLSRSRGSGPGPSEESEKSRSTTEGGKKEAAVEAVRKKAKDLSGAAAIG